MNISFAIITCSDTRSIEEDEAGHALTRLIRDAGWDVVSHVVVKDDEQAISDAIRYASDECHADIVLTCGGTGLSSRDVTPEATARVCERDVPGIAEAIRAASMAITPRAMLSRARCMQRIVPTLEQGERTRLALVINMPGSTKAVCECWDVVAGQLEHALRMTLGEGH